MVKRASFLRGLTSLLYTNIMMGQTMIVLIYTLAALPQPPIASITGHAPAGRCALVICCDYRIMAEGEFVIGLNEVPVGLILPPGTFDLYSLWLGQSLAYRS